MKHGMCWTGLTMCGLKFTLNLSRDGYTVTLVRIVLTLILFFFNVLKFFFYGVWGPSYRPSAVIAGAATIYSKQFECFLINQLM